MPRMLPGHLLNTNAFESAMEPSIVDCLLQVGRWLGDSGYRFITITPATHARMLSRTCRHTAESLADIFGWNLPFHPKSLPQTVVRLLEYAHAVDMIDGGLLCSRIRFSTLGDSLYLHSAYPTAAANAVFFGPDTYRFVALIERILPSLDSAGIHHIADIGCGTGAGGIAAAKLLRNHMPKLVLTDINPLALEYAGINAELAQTQNVSLRCGDLFTPFTEPIELIVANPPYLLDADARIYRHGGGELGSGVSLRIVREGLPRLAPGGTLILYTGSPIVCPGGDILREALGILLDGRPELCWEYSEIDPDVFGEELDNLAYRRVERIAAVALVVHKTDRQTQA